MSASPPILVPNWFADALGRALRPHGADQEGLDRIDVLSPLFGPIASSQLYHLLSRNQSFLSPVHTRTPLG